MQESRLQHHSYAVSQKHYEKELPTLKVSATNWMAEISGESLKAEEMTEAVREKRKIMDREDERMAKEAAERTLKAAAESSNPVTKRTKQWTLMPSERELLEKILTNREDNKGSKMFLPDEKGNGCLFRCKV